MKRDDFRHLERLRVRWAEVDAQRVVFNGHYLLYFDTAMAGYWRALALPYEHTLAQLGGDLFVRKAILDYAAPARYDEVLDVGLRCVHAGRSSLRFEGAVFRGEQGLVSGELVYVYTVADGSVSAPVPPALREVLLGFEKGEPMVELRVGPWTDLEAAARALRAAVFVDEQGIPAALECDDADADAIHAIALNRLGLPLATGRLLQPSPGLARIGRMAVRRDVRGSGVGGQVLQALIRCARERGDREVALHAQASAAAFYARAGFVERGPAFVEAGIEHIEMVRRP